MDLRWGYNNVRIKEENEWKVAFTTPEGSFELMVMFFRLTNSPATFQAMINELLRDLINTGKVVVFIDDVIVGTEDEEGHDKLVAEIVKRLKDNDLYGERSRVSRSGDWTRWNKDGRREGERCTGLADTEVCQRCTKILRIGKLLSLIHPRLCIDS